MKACVYHVLSAEKYFFVCVLIRALWVVFFLLPFYVSVFRVAFLKGGKQLPVIH